MASIPQFCYDHTFPSHFSELQTSAMGAGAGGNGALWVAEENLVPNSAFGNGGFPQTLRSEADLFSSYPRLDMVVPQFNMGSVYGIDCFSVFNGGFQPELSQFGEYCCRKMKPEYPLAGENWGFQNDQNPATIEESHIKVCRYSEAERKERIVRYLKKRNQRNFNKTIKYACRKTLADRRVRVRGRFARNSEVCDHEIDDRKNHSPTTHHHSELYTCDVVQSKQDEEWLQEITNFMYLPYLSMTEQLDFAF